jgi:hypothetical protein
LTNAHGEEPADNGKQKVSAAWILQDFYAGYHDDQHSFLKIKANDQIVLWDPNRKLFAPWSDLFIKKLTETNTFLNNTSPLVLDQHTAIAFDGDFSRYALSFSQYVSVRDDALGGSFYIISSPGQNYVEQRFCCDSLEPIQTLSQRYASSNFINVEKLENGSILFIVIANKSVYALRLSRLPQHSISIGRSVFFLPREPLSTALLRVGPDLKDRYRVVQDAIGSAQVVSTSGLGRLVSAESLFSR